MATAGYDLDDVRDAFPEWVLFRSDAGRLWASRKTPFSAAEEKAGAFRTVDGDDAAELAAAVAAQEDLAGEASQ
ncbi:hypothetical protein [Sphaerimonospora thailandensis]|uniref:Uncharacterized protein n=1 Tax=Sphaerimonospora thailandensis TaxID=795644 RepID=A0A8J3W2G5_9ACTN|nr:hypothetical protein [Sphaerimonospora thailandensis]GIH73235.1 hypothetical protein Mth01_54880 [Sphaerimonospora thailandensis]